MWTGLIAEDVQSVIPDVVIKDDSDRPDSLAYTELVPYLIESVKALQAQLKQQEKRHEAQMKALLERLEKLDRNT